MALRPVQVACWTVGLASLAGIAGVPAPSAHPRDTQVTWTTDVEPILKARCVGCHATDGFGPMSLATYQDARAWASAIRGEVLERRMPPWPAARGFGDYANDRSLSPLEIELVAAWAGGGTPLGPPVPVPGERTVRQEIGAARRSPDLVLTAPSVLASSAPARLELATTFTEDRWITGWEFRPGNRSLVTQAVVSIATGTALGSWTPPEGPILFPSGVAQRMPAGSRLVLELHYRRSATPEHDQSAVALYFGKRPARELRHRRLACGTASIDRDSEVLAVTPRAAGAGDPIEVIASAPDGRVEPLAVVPRYQPQYPITYRFRTGVRLPRGSELHVRSSSPDCSATLELVTR